MIVHIAGQFIHSNPTQVVIEVGGLGYEVHISLQTYDNIKNLTRGKLFTHLHTTGEAQTLYGFASLAEKQWFLYLIGVNGVGPRVAMTILSSLTPDELQHAILNQSVAMLQAVKGIGEKAAQRIILELSTKAHGLATGHVAVSTEVFSRGSIHREALAALARLGIPKSQGEKAILHVLRTHPDELSVEQLIKMALKA
ncbi:MAG: Holliday junction branch migration protein RuvA [Bacteroidota bacterium]